MVNWIAEKRYPADTPWAREDWNRPAKVDTFLPLFADWQLGWLDVPALIRSIAAVYEFSMVGPRPAALVEPGARDAARGARRIRCIPIGSNGASQAILDARILARELATQGGEPGLAAYEAIRRPATAEIVRANRGDGPDRVMDIVHARAPDGFEPLEDVVPRAELEDVILAYKRVAGMDPAILNERESWSVAR